ncbi:hypothetical protein SMC26_08530 [Actinomadura fulvescens]|uniref:Uncharacterized protein n=1 Tax=Actinomadura fulvescens TaxID=46160 RepID=A0ABN3QU39_9ACTN
MLLDEDDPLVDLVQRGTECDAEMYTLCIPDPHRADAARYCWQTDRIESGHPVFVELELGGLRAAARGPRRC